MSRVVPVLAICLLVLGVMPPPARAASDAAVSGVVRDLQGRPQMGALVELLHADASVVARAVTDEHGRYLLTSLLPGTYQLRASAAFLLPALRDRLKLQPGGHTVADVTLTAIFSAGMGLPADRRRAEEPADDWRWTLRSAANRPLLRLADSPDPQEAENEPAVADGSVLTATTYRLEMLSGSGSFGDGGPHETLTLEQAHRDGAQDLMRASLGTPDLSGRAPSIDAQASMDRRGAMMGGGSHLSVAFASHPELGGASGSGLQIVQVATAEQIALGDAVVIDAGTLLVAERLLQSRVFSRPFLQVRAKMNEVTSLEYRVSEGQTFRSGQTFPSKDAEDFGAPMQVLADGNGRPLMNGGLSQELAVTRSLDGGKDTVRFATTYTSSSIGGMQGIGHLSTAELAGLPVLADQATGTFRIALGEGEVYGVGISWKHDLSQGVSATLEEDLGTTPVLPGPPVALPALQKAVQQALRAAVSASFEARLPRSGTRVNAAYRWQSGDTLGRVNGPDAESNEEYLSFCLRQRVGGNRHLRGIDAVVEATNLLAQGYRPVIGPDGETLFLAQVPRALQAGLSFSF